MGQQLPSRATTDTSAAMLGTDATRCRGSLGSVKGGGRVTVITAAVKMGERLVNKWLKLTKDLDDSWFEWLRTVDDGR